MNNVSCKHHYNALQLTLTVQLFWFILHYHNLTFATSNWTGQHKQKVQQWQKIQIVFNIAPLLLTIWLTVPLAHPTFEQSPRKYQIEDDYICKNIVKCHQLKPLILNLKHGMDFVTFNFDYFFPSSFYYFITLPSAFLYISFHINIYCCYYFCIHPIEGKFVLPLVPVKRKIWTGT